MRQRFTDKFFSAIIIVVLFVTALAPAAALGQDPQGTGLGDVDVLGMTTATRATLPTDRDTIVVASRQRSRIIVADDSAPLPIDCTAYRRGRKLEAEISMRSATGVVLGAACDGLYARRSGFDTLTLSVGDARTTFPVIVTIRPRVDTTGGTTLSIRNQPLGFPWAPTARRDSHGHLELYAAYYNEVDDPLPGRNAFVSNLHRFLSIDDSHLVHDGIVIPHAPATGVCGRREDGVENMTIVPRVDAAGWRMYFSSGTSGEGCPGWEVYSAVSKDEKHWTVERGVRIANAPLADTSAHGSWPVGEGMFVRPLRSGNWQMLVSMVEPLMTPEDAFQILEWQSPDQIHWRYVGPAFTSSELPPGFRGNVVSPSIVQLAPGLYRMYFVADNRPEADSTKTLEKSTIWSAATTDFHHWTLEGQLMGARERWLRYVTVVDDHLFFVSQRLTIDDPENAIAADDPHAPVLRAARLIAP